MKPSKKKQTYVITGSDEGIQLNEGIRLAVGGAGYKVPHFSEIVKALKKKIEPNLAIVASAENQWTKDHMDLDDYEQADANMQQQIQALAKREDLNYAGFIKFSDPEELEYEVKAHMVRPKGMHIATKICFTLGGGEKKYNLGQYLISADWVSEVDFEQAQEAIKFQVDYFQSIKDQKLKLVAQTVGKLDDEEVEKNIAVLNKMGFEPEILEIEE